MKRRISGEILIPIGPSFGPAGPDAADAALPRRVLDELAELAAIPVNFPWSNVSKAAIDVDDPSKYADYRIKRLAGQGVLAVVRVSASIQGEPFSSVDAKGKAVTYDRGYNRTLLDDILHKKAMDVVFISNLARPGSISGSPILLRSGKLIGIKPQLYADALAFARGSAKEHGWPTIRELPLKSVVEWLSSPEWILDNIGGSPLARALNAFTYLFTGQEHLDDIRIMYGLIGIEALYSTDRDEGLGTQIARKAQLVLGEKQGMSKIIKKMYDIRSRLVHGQSDFAPCFMEWDAFTWRAKEFNRSVDFAIGILLGTLQAMVVSNRQELSFDYVLKK